MVCLDIIIRQKKMMFGTQKILPVVLCIIFLFCFYYSLDITRIFHVHFPTNEFNTYALFFQDIQTHYSLNQKTFSFPISKQTSLKYIFDSKDIFSVHSKFPHENSCHLS